MAVRSGRLTVALGSSRSGKTKYVLKKMEKCKRALIWDIKGEYPAQHRTRTKAELLDKVKDLAGKAGVIAFTPDSLGDFEFFCRTAQIFVKSQFLDGHNCALLFEETADVTSPGKAPESYGIILRRYLSYGVDIYAVTQRPAESDKTAVGNASIIHICRQQLARDRATTARDTGVPLEVIEKLRADQDEGKFDYITVDTGKGFWSGGVLSFAGGKPRFATSKTKTPL